MLLAISRFHASRIATVAVAPMREHPTLYTSRAPSIVRTPPAALMRTFGPECARINFRSSIVAPDGA